MTTTTNLAAYRAEVEAMLAFATAERTWAVGKGDKLNVAHWTASVKRHTARLAALTA